MNETDKLLTSISEKIKKLIRQNNSLTKDIDVYSEKIHKYENLLKDKNVEIENLSEQYKILKISKSIKTEEGAVDTRKKINEFVREIDKCIGLLNK